MTPSSAYWGTGEHSTAPKEPGVWWKVAGNGNCQWTALPEEAAESILSAFWMGESHVSVRFGENESSDGVTHLYKVNLDDMTAAGENLSEGVRIEMRIVQSPITELNLTREYRCGDPTEVGVWEGELSGIWYKSDDRGGEKILRALRKKHHYAVFANETWLDDNDEDSEPEFVIDLKQMRQINTHTGEQDILQIVGNVPEWSESPPQGPNMMKGFEVPLAPTTTSLLVRAVLDKLVSPRVIDHSLRAKMSSYHKLQSLVVNEYLQKPECQGMYEEFRICFEQSVRKVPGYRGQLLRILKELEDPSNAAFECDYRNTAVRHVFHGTPRKNIESILEKGMDPSRRCTIEGDWFGLNSDACSLYCYARGGKNKCCEKCPEGVLCYRMLVFLVIMPTLEMDIDVIKGIMKDGVALLNTKHQLPLAEIHVVHRDYLEKFDS